MSNARNLSKLIPSSTGLIQTANITDDAITNAKIGAGAIGNTEIDASAAIAQSKLAAIASSNLPAGSIVQVVTMNKTTAQEHTNASWTDYLASADTLKITPTSSSNTIILSTSVKGAIL